VLRGLANWWDSMELWVTQLAFPWQVVLAILVLLPMCAGLAVLADRASDLFDARVLEPLVARFGRRRARADRPEPRP
jgi:hypothetical protein